MHESGLLHAMRWFQLLRVGRKQRDACEQELQWPVHPVLAAVWLLTRCVACCSSALLVALHLAAAAAQITSCAPTYP